MSFANAVCVSLCFCSQRESKTEGSVLMHVPGSMPSGTVSTGTYAPTGTESKAELALVTRRNDQYEAREDALDALMRQNLDAELKRLRLSAYALAKLAGVSPSTLTRFLQGERGLGKMTLHHLVNAGAGVSIDRLMAGKLSIGHPTEAQTDATDERQITNASSEATRPDMKRSETILRNRREGVAEKADELRQARKKSVRKHIG